MYLYYILSLYILIIICHIIYLFSFLHTYIINSLIIHLSYYLYIEKKLIFLFIAVNYHYLLNTNNEKKKKEKL